ncbi:TACC domain containing protein [Asbolus verrucosus]|uniref:TACC domain containing protein n=1 Tax=Asbolus verrucosus TaxID=1661398 RepID=A0A482VL23_ASBVE|nr:TACC domain containing protein [Asbolus verrucosus]
MFSQLYRNYFKGSQEVADGEKLGQIKIEDKIITLEKKIAQVEEQNKQLEKQLDYSRNKEAALQKVLCNYDNLLKKVLTEKTATRKQDETSYHLANLEKAFYDLLQKYEKAKVVVQGFQQNEALLKKQVAEYEDMLDNAGVKVTTYKSLSGQKLEIQNESVKKPKSKDESKGKKKRLLTTI